MPHRTNDDSRVRAESRDRGLRRVRTATGWITVASAAGAVVLAGGYAQALPGKSSTAASTPKVAPSSAASSPTAVPTTASGAARTTSAPVLRPPSSAPTQAPATTAPAAAPTTAASSAHATSGGS